MLGFPGKMGMSGDKVWDTFLNGDIESIRNYCETDVLNTYLVYLKFELMRGNLTLHTYQDECDRLAGFLKDNEQSHLTAFLKEWRE
jgi:predicted PolB exonuclease-like 3'-5' exonuclease